MTTITRALKSLFTRPTPAARHSPPTRLGMEPLECRTMPSVSQLWTTGSLWVVRTDDAATTVTLTQSGSNYVLTEGGSGRTWSKPAAAVGRVEFQGGAGNDRFVNSVPNLPVNGFGNGGDDYLQGYNGADVFCGGAGNDTLIGSGGDDRMWGGAGDDLLRGMDGNDQLVGEDGNDRLNGGAGADLMWGGAGDDVLVGIDDGTADYADGGAGRDVIWVDKTGASSDRVYGTEAGDKVQYVTAFRNGADRTLDGDRLADPALKSGAEYRTVAGHPLFSAAGPKATDVRQGSLNDCWLLAGLGAIATDSPHTLRQNLVDFDDGTYGVRLGDGFYRVDNDLPVRPGTSTAAYAGPGAGGSMWVAIAEKAYAYHRTGQNSYASVEWGWAVEVNRAFGATAPGDRTFASYASAATLANEIYARWNRGEAVTVGVTAARGAAATGAPLHMDHTYMVTSVVRNSAGVVTAITLRNPWGRDGIGNDGAGNDGSDDGYVTVTPDQIFAHDGRVNWGRV